MSEIDNQIDYTITHLTPLILNLNLRKMKQSSLIVEMPIQTI